MSNNFPFPPDSFSRSGQWRRWWPPSADPIYFRSSAIPSWPATFGNFNPSDPLPSHLATMVRSITARHKEYWAIRSFVRSLVCSHRSLILLLRTACFAHALRCAHLFTRSLNHSRERGFYPWFHSVEPSKHTPFFPSSCSPLQVLCLTKKVCMSRKHASWDSCWSNPILGIW